MSLKPEELRCLPTRGLRRFRGASTRVEDVSDIMSSSVSEDRLGMIVTGGKKNVGSVGMETGNEGLEERLKRCGKVGEIGEDWGVLRRRNVEIGVLATRSASNVSFAGRRADDEPNVEERCLPTIRCGDIERGEVDSAWKRRSGLGQLWVISVSLTRDGRLSASPSCATDGKLPRLICDYNDEIQ